MPAISTLNYANPPSNYFWDWSHDDSAAEWADFTTLSLREEILSILQALADSQGIPPLGALLLTLTACTGDLAKAKTEIHKIIAEVPLDPEVLSFLDRIEEALALIRALPVELRTGLRAKVELCQALFSRHGFSHEATTAQSIVQQLQSEPPSLWRSRAPELESLPRLLRDGKALLTACAGLTPETLEHLIRTGIEFPHLGLAPILEGAPLPENDARPLLDRIDDGTPELRGLTRLARQIIGLLSLPSPAQQQKELPLGGVSDIINRGQPDKLLTSELAWDDLALATRLAHGEALFYRHETPPESAPAERLLLMDHGLRFWGTLRLYTLATLLGLKAHETPGRTIATRCFTTDQYQHKAITLENSQEVRHALTQLPAHLDPVPSLNSLQEELTQNPPAGTPDLFFITTQENIAEAKTALFSLVTQIRKLGGRCYLILLTRTGDLALEEHLGAQTKRLQTGKLDLDEILPPKEETPSPSTTLFTQPLAQRIGTTYYDHYPLPTLFSTDGGYQNTFIKDFETNTTIGVSVEKRLMCWFDPTEPAQELSPKLPGRAQWIHRDEGGQLMVACSADEAGESVRVFTVSETGAIDEIAICKASHSFPSSIRFYERNLIIIYSNLIEALSLDEERVIDSMKIDESETSGRFLWMKSGKIAIALMTEELKEPRIRSAIFDSKTPGTNERIEPKGIIMDPLGKLTILTAEKICRFELGATSWIPNAIGNQDKVMRFSEFRSIQCRTSPTEPELQQAPLNSAMATYDQRGLLHITREDGESWTFGLFTGLAFAWNHEFDTLSGNDRWTKPNNKVDRQGSCELYKFLKAIASES